MSMLIFVYGRSGVQPWLKTKLGLHRIYRGPTTRIQTNFRFDSDWESEREEQRLTKCQAFVVAFAKAIFWHFLQIGWFWVAYYAYSPLMGWGQLIFATMVAIREAGYFALLLVAVFRCPHFLLFSPMSDRSVSKRLMYLLCPDMFVAESLADTPSKPSAEMIAWGSLFLSLSAYPAIFLGLHGDGVMYPALLSGYAFSAVASIGFLLTKTVWKDTDN